MNISGGEVAFYKGVVNFRGGERCQGDECHTIIRMVTVVNVGGGERRILQGGGECLGW